jgi:hypothetical protein
VPPPVTSSTATGASVERGPTARARASQLWEALRERWPQLWPWAPLALAGVYGIVVLVNFSSLINAINMDSDVSIALMIGKLAGSAPHGAQVVLGDHPWYEALWFLHLTRGLPGYRQLWEFAPMLWSLAGIAILAWSAWSAFGRWPAALVASALLCAGTAGRFMFFSFDWHGPTALHTVFLGALVVWLAGRAPRFANRQLVAIALVMGLISAAPATGDKLFLYWAILPLVFTAGLLVWRTRAGEYLWILGVAVAIGVIALAVGAFLHSEMVAMGWVGAPFEIYFAASSALVSNFMLLVESYANLAGGNFFRQPASGAHIATFASGVLLLAAIVLLVLELRRRIATAAPGLVPLDPLAARRFAYVTFWASSFVTTSLAFVLSSAPVDANSARYVLAGYVAVGALLPLLALRSRFWKAAVTAGVCAFALIASYQVIRNPFEAQLKFPTPQQAQALARFAKAEHVKYGYTGYWDAGDLTWMSGFGVKVYPVTQCTPQNLAMCPFNIGISSWYKPRPNTKSMLVIDHGIQLKSVAAPNPGDGAPIASTTIGDLTVYVYPFDIASHFG